MVPVPSGTRVQLCYVLLNPTERAPGIPQDTAKVPYEVRVRGRLTSPAELGQDAEARTSTGRLIRGTLEIVEPGDTHTFGRPDPVLVECITAIELLKEGLA